MRRQRKSVRLLAVLVGASLIAAACGGDDDSADDTGTEDTADADGDETEPADDGDTAEPADDGDAAEPADDGAEPADDGDAAEPADGPALATELTAGVGEVGGSGCGTPHGPYEDSTPTGEVRFAWNDPLLTFNNNHNRGTAVANSNVLYLTGLDGGIQYYNSDLELINNDSFGICIIDSLDPLTITYRINEGVTWSDGTPVDAADLLLYWASLSGVYNTGAVEDLYDEEGNLVETDAVVFDGSSESLALVTQFPVLGADGRSIQITWDEFYVDYQIAGLEVGVPAHVVAKNALGIDDPIEAKQALIDALRDNDAEAVKSIADFWNTGFDYNRLPDDPDIYIGHGAYNLVQYDEMSEMLFEAREDYTWGPQPSVQTIVYRIIGDPTAAIQAMTNEEIDVFLPQATAETLTELEAVADRGIVALTGDGATYEHVDLVFNNGGPFDPATYGGDEEVAKAVRQAFLLTIPRQEIIDRLIAPLNPTAEVRNSFLVVPGAPAYDDIVANNGSATYSDVDIEQAIALLEEAGVTTPIDVRFMFADNNPRRAAEYDLISASAAQAGFNVIDGRSPTWSAELPNTSVYDASLFGWQSTSVCVACTNANFVTDGGNNYGGYSSETVDELYRELQGTTDAVRQDELMLAIETELWNDAFGTTIFQFPEVVGYNSTYVENVYSMPLSPTVLVSVFDWQAT